jgi:branched-chain amino acid transport system permease protein
MTIASTIAAAERAAWRAISVRWLLAAALLAVGLAVPLVAGEFATKFVTRILIYGLAAVSLDLLLGYAGLVSFGHAAFVAIGAYVTGILTNAGYESAFVVWPSAMLAASAAALVIGALSLRSSGLYFIMITLAFAQMVFYALQSLRAYGGDDGFATSRNTLAGLLDPYDAATFYYVVLALAIAITGLLALATRAEFGVALRAARDDALRLQSLGLAPFPYRLLAFTASGGIAGLAGALTANLTGYIVPSLASWQLSGELLVMVPLGGAGTLVGGFVGAALFLGLAEVLSDLTDHWMFYLGILIVLRVLFLREGFLDLLGRRSRSG